MGTPTANTKAEQLTRELVELKADFAQVTAAYRGLKNIQDRLASAISTRLRDAGIAGYDPMTAASVIPKLKLWHISQNKYTGYDTYDSAVVCAPDEETARSIHPSGNDKSLVKNASHIGASAWAVSPEDVTAKYLGEAGPDTVSGVVCASFNAG